MEFPSRRVLVLPDKSRLGLDFAYWGFKGAWRSYQAVAAKEACGKRGTLQSQIHSRRAPAAISRTVSAALGDGRL